MNGHSGDISDVWGKYSASTGAASRVRSVQNAGADGGFSGPKKNRIHSGLGRYSLQRSVRKEGKISRSSDIADYSWE